MATAGHTCRASVISSAVKAPPQQVDEANALPNLDLKPGRKTR
jgi:hypothetical protein